MQINQLLKESKACNYWTNLVNKSQIEQSLINSFSKNSLCVIDA